MGAVRSLPARDVAPWAGAPRQAGGPVAIDRVLDRFRVTYRVDTGRPLGSSRSADVLSVNRPFEGRLVTTDPGRHGALRAETRSALGRQLLVSPGQAPQVLAVPADLANGDVRLDLAVDRLVADGRLERRERRGVLGRPCQVYRSSGLLDGGSLGRPSAGDFVDSCVDAAGLVLAEVQYSGARVTRRRIATEVAENPVFAAGSFSVGDPTVPPGQGGGSFVPVDPSTGPSGRAFALDVPPDGFALVGRFADVSPAASDPLGNPTSSRRAGFSDVYVRGRDIVVVDQGAMTIGGAPFATDPFGQPVDLGPLGRGEAITGTRLQVVRVLVPGGRTGDYVRMAGTIPIDQLAALARSLRAVSAP